jgi:LysM repeat protein
MDKDLGIPTKPTVAITDKKAAIPNQPKAEQPMVTTNNPTRYTIVKGDNLYKLSKQFKLTESELMQMNGMKDDKLRLGQVLIIGQTQIPAPTPTPAMIDTPKVIKTIMPNKTQFKAAMPAAINPLKKDTNNIKKSLNGINLTKPIKTDTLLAMTSQPKDSVSRYIVKKDSVLIVKTDSTLMAKQLVTPNPLLGKDTIANVEIPKQIELMPEPSPIKKNNKYVNEEGYFASFFNRKSVAENQVVGDAGIFKTASGWNDKKYYILINGLLPGTIVRVTANNKSICAKVLTGLPEIKEDNGYLARLSNAAVVALGIETNKFEVTVNHE